MAAERLRGLVVVTPALRCHALERQAGCELWVKAENLQHIGAFKARGAQYAVARLTDAERAAGIITYSSGNHAQAVALAAQRNNIAAHIFMPVDAPAVKVASVRGLGATVTHVGTTSTERKNAALAYREEHGGTIIEPFDHPDIIAGQGTATLEFVDQIRAATGGDLDALVVPVGGGGLLAGACLVLADTNTAIFAAEPIGCDSMGASLRANVLTPVEPGPTIADGLKPTTVGQLNFDIARRGVEAAFAVSDEDIGRALALLAIRCKLVVEPSGAAALAVALRGELPGAPARVGVLLSGGNVAPDQLAGLISAYAPTPT